MIRRAGESVPAYYPSRIIMFVSGSLSSSVVPLLLRHNLPYLPSTPRRGPAKAMRVRVGGVHRSFADPSNFKKKPTLIRYLAFHEEQFITPTHHFMNTKKVIYRQGHG